MFAMDADLTCAYELVVVDDPHRCWFVDDAAVERDGRLFVLSRVHPALLLLPLVTRNASVS